LLSSRSSLFVLFSPLNFGFDMQIGDSNDDGTATFNGAGTTLETDRITVGSNDHSGTLSFSNGAAGSSDDTLSISRGSLNVQSGSTFDVNRSLFMGNATGGFTGATINVNGGASDSTLNLNDFSSIGSDTGNTATLNINNGGIVAASDSLVINMTGEMEVRTGGTFNTNRSVSVSGGLIHVEGGEANFNSSSSNISVINDGVERSR
jgi:T5SS/PEP-CTERM-associated repeat protein